MAHTYIPLMQDHHHGFPLWFPDLDLSLPPCYRNKGIRVGDLGYINVRGGFTYLFNVYASADDPINEGRVPPIFEPLEDSSPSAREQELHPKHHTLTTPGIQQTASAGGALTSTFSCSSTQLVLPDGAVRYDASQPVQAKLHKYAKKYAQYWYQYFNDEQGREMRNGSLYLVTGCDKCHSWEAVCFHPPSHDSVSSPFSIVGAAGGGAISHEWMFQTGPSRRNHRKDTVDPNQAIFLRGYSMSVREKPMIQEQLLKDKTADAVEIFSIDGNKTKGPLIVPLVPYGVESRYGAPVEDMDMYGEGAENDSEDDADSSDDDEDPERFSQEAEVIEDKPQVYNPSARINEYILQKIPHVDVAITHDKDWMRFMRLERPDGVESDTKFLCDEGSIRRFMERADIISISEGCVTFEIATKTELVA